MTETLAYGTHMKVLRVSCPMNTNMTGFRWFSKIFASLYLGRKYPQHWKGYVTIWKISAWKWMDEIILSNSILSCCWIVQQLCISSITVSRFHGVFKWNTKNQLQPWIRKCDSQGKRNYFLILTCDARTFFFTKKNDVDGDIGLKDMKSIHAQRAMKKIYFRDNYPVNHHLEYIWRDIQIISCMDNFPLIIFDFALSRNCYYIFISWENTSIIQLNSYNIKFRSDIFKFCLTPKLLLYFHWNLWKIFGEKLCSIYTIFTFPINIFQSLLYFKILGELFNSIHTINTFLHTHLKSYITPKFACLPYETLKDLIRRRSVHEWAFLSTLMLLVATLANTK